MKTIEVIVNPEGKANIQTKGFPEPPVAKPADSWSKPWAPNPRNG